MLGKITMKSAPLCGCLGVLAILFTGCANQGIPTLEGKRAPGLLLEDGQRALPRPGESLRAVSANGIKLTKRSEGFVPRLYNDPAGYCTIAYGHLIKKARCDGTESAEFRAGVTEPRGGEILVDDMAGAKRTVSKAVTVELSDSQYAALCDFVFNVGSENFRTSTLLKVVNREQFERVPAQLRRWVLADKKPLPGLVTRRQDEIRLFFEGLPIPRSEPRPGEDLGPVDIGIGEPEK